MPPGKRCRPAGCDFIAVFRAASQPLGSGFCLLLILRFQVSGFSRSSFLCRSFLLKGQGVVEALLFHEFVMGAALLKDSVLQIEDFICHLDR